MTSQHTSSHFSITQGCSECLSRGPDIGALCSPEIGPWEGKGGDGGVKWSWENKRPSLRLQLLAACSKSRALIQNTPASCSQSSLTLASPWQRCVVNALDAVYSVCCVPNHTCQKFFFLSLCSLGYKIANSRNGINISEEEKQSGRIFKTFL